jgi:Ca2+-binding EF-hand superfamily protein
MTINAISPIYDFRPASRVSETRPTARPAAKQETSKKQQLDLFEPQAENIHHSDPHPATGAASGDQDSVGALLDQFFIDKVKRHDADRDGLLSQQEFYGSEEQFAILDEDEDGQVGAADLKRHFLAGKPEMREMAEGFTSRLYDQILNSVSDDSESLARTVEEFFTDIFERDGATGDGQLDVDEFPGTPEEFRQIAGENAETINRDDMVRHFHKGNPDLVELRQSLRQLKDMVRPAQARSRSIDTYS